MRKLRNASVCAMVLGSAIACSPAPPRERASSASVDAVNVAFAPAQLEIDPGTEVVWTNRDAQVRHTVTSGRPGSDGVPGVSKAMPDRPDGLFDGVLPDASAEFEFTFDEPGTYEYFCRVHPSMTGEIVVKARA